MAKRMYAEQVPWLEHVAQSWWPVCIPWPYKSLDRKGYAKVWWRGRKTNAATVVCSLAHGARPPGLCCRHLCGHAWCMNPRHLCWGTYAENEADKLNHGTYFRRRHQVTGH